MEIVQKMPGKVRLLESEALIKQSRDADYLMDSRTGLI